MGWIPAPLIPDPRYSMPMRRLIFACAITLAAFAQQLPNDKQMQQQMEERENPPVYTPRVDETEPPKPLPAELPELVRKQFGPDFSISLKRTSSTARYLNPQKDLWTPFLTTDLNGDGIEDAIIVARNKKVLNGQAQFNYKVVDPYFTYNGFGDVKITSTLSSDDPDQGHVVLIIHGAGPEAWRAATPKAKFAVINLPFENLTITSDLRRQLLALETRDAAGNAAIFWDGKKYKWKEW
jgi:hypothetical protein